ncbi:response regulator transcription factor [Agromyces sp. NPDC058126]|uniref:response regulator transcription factor n=1 Tax=Agromyces sp. NPDC058126 TaxID=3346350 RepID=UPI0036DCE895
MLGFGGREGSKSARLIERTRTGLVLPDSAEPELLVSAVNLLIREHRPESPPRSKRPRPALLTSRQEQVLELAARGLTNVQVASALELSEGTVKRHLFDAFRRLSANSRIDAVNRARAMGYAV